MFRNGYDFNKFLTYKDKLSKELNIKDWKKEYVYDCKVIYINSVKLRDMLRTMYPTDFFSVPLSFLNLNQIVSINLKTKQLRYIVSNMDHPYPSATNFKPKTITHRKKIYNDLILMRMEFIKSQQN